MKKFLVSLFLILLSCYTLSSCKKTKSNPECGCNSVTIQTIEGWKGYVFFSNSEKKYEVQIGVPGLYSNYFVCDTAFSELHLIIDTNRTFKYYVLFSGDVTKFCVPDTIAGYIDQMYNIRLSNIKKIN